MTVALLQTYCFATMVATTRQAARLLRSTLHSPKCYPDEIHAAALHGYASQPCEAMRRAPRAMDARQMMHLQLGWPAHTSSRMRPA